MPTLLIMRHGKSDWSASYSLDHDRPLAPRGVNAAQAVGAWLTDNESTPDLILSSTAVRAADTARLAAESGGWTCDLLHDRRLYGCSPETVITVIREVDPCRRRVMIVGHNPTWADLVPQLTKSPARHFPTAAVACIEVAGRWNEFGPGDGELRWFVTPRDLNDRPPLDTATP